MFKRFKDKKILFLEKQNQDLSYLLGRAQVDLRIWQGRHDSIREELERLKAELSAPKEL